MPIFHCSVLPISRGKGRSATAAAAYRSGEKIVDERTGLVHDYTRKKGIDHKEIIFPKNVQFADSSRSTLWNQIEASEKRSNSKVAREIRVALPHEIDRQNRIELTREFITKVVERYGIVADICIHDPGKQGDQRNHHAHVLISTRELTPDGFGKKVRVMDDKKQGPEEVKWIRETWADLTNRYLEKSNIKERVDHRSYADQGVGKEPGAHLGPAATALGRKRIGLDKDVLAKDLSKLVISKTAPSKKESDTALKLLSCSNYNDDAKSLNYDALKTQKVNELNLRVKQLQDRISQKIADIRDQQEELQDLYKFKSRGLSGFFKKAELRGVQSELCKMTNREAQLINRRQILRSYTDNDIYGTSKLMKRADRYMKKFCPHVMKKSSLQHTQKMTSLSKNWQMAKISQTHKFGL